MAATVVRSFSKINLGLRIGPPRTDGFHHLTTLYQTAALHDLVTVEAVPADATEIYHLAAQVAVTTSLVTPLQDFEVNARGTLNVLEAARGEYRILTGLTGLTGLGEKTGNLVSSPQNPVNHVNPV